jgi:hypothetical protein
LLILLLVECLILRPAGLPKVIAIRVAFHEHAAGLKGSARLTWRWKLRRRPRPVFGQLAHASAPPASRGFPEGLLLNLGDWTFVGGHLIDPRTKNWTTIATPWWSRQKARTVLASTDVIFVWGGASDDANLADGYLQRL